jgi:precorrin-6Y C5,15-methyltransferase (decarboxylating)
LAEAVAGFKARGFKTEITLVQIARSQPVLNLTRFDSLNPIYIIAAEREVVELQQHAEL